MPLDFFFFFSAHGLFQRKVNTDWVSLLCRKGCYNTSGINSHRKKKETIWMLLYLHWCNRGKWVNIIYTYSAGIVSSPSLEAFLSDILWCDINFFTKMLKKKMQVHLKYAFSKDFSVLQLQNCGGFPTFTPHSTFSVWIHITHFHPLLEWV